MNSTNVKKQRENAKFGKSEMNAKSANNVRHMKNAKLANMEKSS